MILRGNAWRTRFAGIPPAVAFSILVALAILIAIGFSRNPPTRGEHGIAGQGDVALYQAIGERIAGGSGYYNSAVAEHRARRFPLRPFVTVRLPTLAEIEGYLGFAMSRSLLDGLAITAALAFCMRLRQRLALASFAAASLAIGLGLAGFLVSDALFFHESWAATLIVLSLALRSREHWTASVMAGLAACSIRELALPYLFVMALSALVDGSRKESIAWLAAIAGVVALLVAHAVAVHAHTTGADLASQGWTAGLGWPFILSMLRYSLLLTALPNWVAAIVVPCSLLGWLAWRDALGLRCSLYLLGFVTAFMLVGRADNDYWGLFLTPLMPVGLVFAPAALADLVHSCTHRVPSSPEPIA